MSRIHIATQDGGRFEYELDELDTLWREGSISREALYWKEGMSDWLPLRDLLEEGQGSVAPKQYHFVKDPSGLTQLLIIMLWVSIGFEVISIISHSMELALLERIYSASEAEIASNDTRQGMVGLGYLAVFIVTGVVFLKWIYRANLNARNFTQKTMEFTPGWSIGYYFIPFLNLYKPFRAMREIWQISKDPVDGDTSKSPALLQWWWTFWLATGIFGQISARLAFSADADLETYQMADVMSILSGVTGIVVSLVALRMVMQIYQSQKDLVLQSD